MRAVAQKTGLFGGSFDPIHVGHLILAREAREQLGLDRVIFIPAGISPHKLDREPAPAELRLAMVRAAVAGEPGFEVEDCELRREGPSYTIATVRTMRERYPAAHVLDDVLFVHDGPVSTSAGIASGIDLALSLVEADRGPAFAAAVARELVVYTRRNGSAAPLSPFLAHRDHLDPVVHAVQDTLAADLAGAHPLAELAARAHLSPRGLSRAFVAATGLTPAQYQTELRLGHARTLLRGSALTVEEIAQACGYADPRHFRRMFGAHEGVSPSAWNAPFLAS